MERLEKALESDPASPVLAADLSLLRHDIDAVKASQALIKSQLELFDVKIKEITLATADGIERVDRAERRVKATIQSARRKFAEGGYVDEGVEAEDQELRLVDGTGSEEQGLQPVSEEVEEVGGTASSIPGVSIEQLQRARGF